MILPPSSAEVERVGSDAFCQNDQYPANPRHIGEHVRKRRFDLKMTAVECRKVLSVDKSTLADWDPWPA